MTKLDRHRPAAGLSRRDFLATGLSLSLAPTLLGCVGSPSDPAADGGDEATREGPRLTAQPGEPSVTPTLGLTALGLGGSRDGLLYVPEDYSADTPAPLFVAFHGAGGDADNWVSYPGRAEARGMVFLAIDSRDSTWDVVRFAFGPDVAFLDRALEHTFERVRIDPARIALGGFSDGASYALSLGVSNGDLFSHLVAYSPGFIRSQNPIVGKPPVYISHGTFDGVLPVEISTLTIVPGLRDEGYDVTFEEFAGGHEVPSEISDAALDWFLAGG